MRHSTFVPHSLKLLAGAMAVIASGQALAETAGKVSFVTGNVTATTPDGQSRALKRGDAINGGDRIETRGGRLQIRFTDGGFVALQPNTVFGVDQYLYANKAPEETSLFFSLLRGGMRTVTGAIGKVNKQSYKVRTPVATIGIRGTGYRARTDGSRTLVSVGTGLVFVENGFGNVTGSAGQNILATSDLPPSLTREAAELPATGPEGDSEEELFPEDDSPAFGEQITPNGDPLLLTTGPDGEFLLIEPVVSATLPNTDSSTNTPLYTVITPSMFDGAQSGLAATFDQSTDTDRRGALLTLQDTAANPAFDLFNAGTLQFHGVTTVGNISWGEFTNGQAGTNILYSASLLSDTQFESYVIGKSIDTSIQPKAGKASYSLQGGTAPRLNLSTAGTLDAFKIDVDFAMATMDVRLDLTMSGATFSATGDDISFSSLDDSFMLSGLSTTSSDISACSSFCSTSISGFFAGSRDQIGAAYSMFTGLGNITGSAALGQTSFTSYVNGSFAAPIYGEGPNFLHQDVSALIDPNNGGLLAMLSEGSPLFDSGSLHFNGVGKTGNLTWGEFTDGAAAIDNLGSGLVASATQFEPYIFGSQSTTLLGSGKATYSLQGHSTPRLNQSTAATLNNFNITIDFDFALMDLALGVTASGLTANVTGNDIDVSEIFVDGAFSLSSFNNNEISVSGSACGSFCSADISGFFAGTGGTQIGSAYSISTDIGTIKGVAALGVDTLADASDVLPDAQVYTLAHTMSSGVLGGYNHGDPMTSSLLADFTTTGELASAAQTYPSPFTRLENLTASVVDKGTQKTLSWGRFVNGDVAIDGSPLVLSGPDSVHYVIGQETPSNMMSALMIQGGTATYNLSGHTTPSSINGTGSSVSGSLLVDFTSSAIGVDLDVTMPVTTYSVSGNIGFSGAAFSASGLTTTSSSVSACMSGCSTNINGFFSGQQAQQIGLTYQINDFMGGAVKGAASFERGDIAPGI